MNPVIRLKTIATEMLKPIVQVVYCLFALCVVGYLVFGVFSGLDGAGWISHSHDTPVWIEGDWLVGEYRDCEMRTKTIPKDRPDLDSLGLLPRLFCAPDEHGLFDFQRETASVSPPSDLQPPPLGSMYLFSVTKHELDEKFHTMPVSYHGRIDREDKWVLSWRCQRLSASLECKAIN